MIVVEKIVNKKFIWFALWLLLLQSFSLYVVASDTWVTLTWENDFIAHEDSGYTNGMGISWGYGPFGTLENGPLPNWLETAVQVFPDVNAVQRTHEMSYRIVQTMYTPEDIQVVELIEDDRPYVGMLLWHANLHSYDEAVSDRYWLTLGMIGPVSGAEQVQKTIHQLIGKKRPNGWRNQLKNEPVFDLSAERLWRLHSHNITESVEYDLVGISAGDLGTLKSEIGAGIGFRVGRALTRSFMAALVIPGRNINPLAANLKNEWHLFANLYSRYVFNDIIFDGNTFRESHSVTLTHEQLLYAVGASYHARLWGIVVSVQDGTRFFEERVENAFFATLSYTYRW